MNQRTRVVSWEDPAQVAQVINVPTVLLGGDRSPAHLGERLDAIERVMPHAEWVGCTKGTTALI